MTLAEEKVTIVNVKQTSNGREACLPLDKDRIIEILKQQVLIVPTYLPIHPLISLSSSPSIPLSHPFHPSPSFQVCIFHEETDREV